MLVRVSCGSCGGEGGGTLLSANCGRYKRRGRWKKEGGGGAKPCDTTNATCSVLLCRRCPRGFDMI